MVKQVSAMVILWVILLSLALTSTIAPVAASPTSVHRFSARGGIPGPPTRDTPPVVSILSPSDGATVNGNVTISADATDDVGIEAVEYRIDSGGWTPMSNVGGSTYQANWDSSSIYDAGHTITVRATDTSNNEGTDYITVTTSNGVAPPPPTTEYELWIEIDYMVGHTPTPEVLDYIECYYMGNNPSGELISVTFYVDDIVPLDPSVSTAEFWAIEAAYNDLGDDKYTGKSANFVSKWKWVLFGTTVEGQPNVVGYTYVLTKGNDLVAGNYIFIADETGDSWASNSGIYDYGAEAVVLMHEIGHSIGIANFHPAFGEIYDPDPGSVMSYLSTANAGLYWAWYYSDDYWATRNMEYYAT